ncbi:MAG: GAF domain-containing protein [Chloroflexi bacterium]|nr:GAF domain-containing protein [Chloroflexota bacterium]
MGLVVLVHDITDEREAQKEQENLARELEEQLAQVNALQRAMAREGWAAFLANQDRGATGFSFAGDTVQPFNDASWLKSLSEMPLNLDELNTVSYDEKQTAVAMPLQIHGESVGVLGARNANGAPLDEEQQMLLATLTVQVAEALERARLFEETELGRQEIEAQAAELAIVNEISELVSSQLNLQSLVNAVGDRLIQTFSANSAYVALVNEKTKAINFPYFTNIIDGPLNISPRTLDDRGLYCQNLPDTTTSHPQSC